MGETLYDAFDRLAVRSVSIVSDNTENDGSIPAYVGIEAARTIRDLFFREATKQNASDRALIEKLVGALARARGELIYMKEKMPHTNAAQALAVVEASLSLAESRLAAKGDGG